MNSSIFGIGPIAGHSAAANGHSKGRARLGRCAAAIAGILLAAPTGARAGTLAAPLLYPDQNSFVACTATNGGTTPAKVAITGRGAWGDELKAYGQQCSDLAPGVSCTVNFNYNEDAACTVVYSGKVRAVESIYDISVGRTLLAIPATK